MLVSNALVSNLVDSAFLPWMWSDHAGLEASFWSQNTIKTHARWRLNTNLLNLEPMCTNLEREVESYLELNENCGVSPQMVWDALKAVVGGKMISISSFYKKETQAYKWELLNSITQLEKQHEQTCSNKVYRQLQTEQKKLEALEISQIQQNILYMRQKYWLCRPKQQRLLAWKVKQRRSANQIQAICTPLGTRVTQMKDILSAFRVLYSGLYTSTNPDLDDIWTFFKNHIPHFRLTEEHKQVLDDPILPEEVCCDPISPKQ